MTPDEAIAKLTADGIPLDMADVQEIKSASDQRLKTIVSGWFDVLSPAEAQKDGLLTKILRVLQQVADWAQAAAKIAAIFGITL